MDFNINVTIGVTPQLEKLLAKLPTNLETTLGTALAPVTQFKPIPAGTPVIPINSKAPLGTPPVQSPQPVSQRGAQSQPAPTNKQPSAGMAVPTTAPQPAAQPTQQPAQSVPTSTPTYSLDDLAKAASQLMDAGKQQQLFDLLGSFNVQALTQVSPEQYGVFATKLRELGAVL